MGPHAHVPTPPGVHALEFSEGILVPGLVNCHTHLELTHLAGHNAEPEFANWIRRIRELKDATPAEEFRAAAEQGIRDCWARGVTCVAETGSTGSVMAALHALGGRGVVYQEVFGPDPAKCDASLAELDAAVRRLRPLASTTLRLGVSPHAPYTVSESLYRAVAAYGRREGLPIALHLAESRAETDLVRDGSGPFAEALRARGIRVEAHGRSPVTYLVELGVLASGNCLCIHCVQVDETDIGRLKTENVSVAHCPRSNRAHGHGAAPTPAFRAAGIRVGLGTDSVVSVGDLDFWAEARAAGFDGEAALRMLTLEGARALRWDTEIGSLEVGKSADLAVFPSTVLYRPLPPSTDLFIPSSTAFLTVVSGRVVHPHK